MGFDVRCRCNADPSKVRWVPASLMQLCTGVASACLIWSRTSTSAMQMLHRGAVSRRIAEWGDSTTARLPTQPSLGSESNCQACLVAPFPAKLSISHPTRGGLQVPVWDAAVRGWASDLWNRNLNSATKAQSFGALCSSTRAACLLGCSAGSAGSALWLLQGLLISGLTPPAYTPALD